MTRLHVSPDSRGYVPLALYSSTHGKPCQSGSEWRACNRFLFRGEGSGQDGCARADTGGQPSPSPAMSLCSKSVILPNALKTTQREEDRGWNAEGGASFLFLLLKNLSLAEASGWPFLCSVAHLLYPYQRLSAAGLARSRHVPVYPLGTQNSPVFSLKSYF